MFEAVYTYEWYDGPREGVADLQGRPHLFQSEWQDVGDSDADTFLLMPLDAETFALAIEDWAIWRRWETAFHQGTATRETHPALPEDRIRHEELQRSLHGRLALDPVRAVRKEAEFRQREDPEWSGFGWHPLEVSWTDPSGERAFENLRRATEPGPGENRRGKGAMHSDIDASEILRRYAAGERRFAGLWLADGSDLRGVQLEGITFEDGGFSDIDVRGANLRGATFRRSNLKCTDFRGADQTNAVFEDVLIERAAFAGAVVDGCTFARLHAHSATFDELRPEEWD